MALIRSFTRYGTFPLIFIGGNYLGILMARADFSIGYRVAVLGAIAGVILILERIAPYQRSWNNSHEDQLSDVIHVIVNTGITYGGIFLLPAFVALTAIPGAWPNSWPFAVQVIAAILILDFGVTLAHYASHRLNLLWRFHAVHHSATRMYGLNGIMKHPVHLGIETFAGMLPLLLLGIPFEVATAVVFAVTLQLLLQHANVDMRTGPFKYLFAVSEVHRFHHRRGKLQGDVNFGLFTMLWDHMLQTFFFSAEKMPENELGLARDVEYPRTYAEQMREPFRRSRVQSPAMTEKTV